MFPPIPSPRNTATPKLSNSPPHPLSQVFASSKYPGPPSVRDFESVFADAVYEKRCVDDQLDQLSKDIAAAASTTNPNKTKESATFYTVPLKRTIRAGVEIC